MHTITPERLAELRSQLDAEQRLRTLLTDDLQQRRDAMRHAGQHLAAERLSLVEIDALGAMVAHIVRGLGHWDCTAPGWLHGDRWAWVGALLERHGLQPQSWGELEYLLHGVNAIRALVRQGQ